MNFELLCSICPNDHRSTWKKEVDKTPGKNWRYDKHLESSPLDLGGIYNVFKCICKSETMEICYFKPVMDHHQKQPLSIFYILPLRNKFHAKQEHMMLEIDISLSVCPIWTDYKQYFWTDFESSKRFQGNFYETFFFRTPFHLTFCLGQKTWFFAWMININHLHNTTN